MTETETLFEVFQELRSLDARLSLDGERLTLSAPKGALPDRLRAAIARRKPEIITFLREARENQRDGFQLERVPEGQGAPLSFAQQRLWFLHHLDPASTAYNLGVVLEIPGAVDEAVLEHALSALAKRHEILRTVFRVTDGVPAQIVTEMHPRLHRVETSAPTAALRAAELFRLREAEVAIPFDLAGAPPIRATFARFDAEHSALVIVLHHILADGWSLGIMVKELGALYQALASGGEIKAGPLPWQYADFAYSQRRRFSATGEEFHAEFWKQRMSGSPPVLELPLDRPRDRVLGSRGAFQTFVLPAELANALRALSSQAGVTLSTTMQSLFKILLHRASGQTDILIGAPFADRPRAELEPLIGLFVSTMVLRTDLSGDPSVREVLGRVHQGMLEAHQHREYPFEKIVDLARPDRSLAHAPLFQVAFIFHNTPFTRPSFTTIGGGATYELSLNLWEGGADLPGSMEFNTALFDAATITRMIGHFRMLAEAAVADPAMAISRLPMLSPLERSRVLSDWNDTRTPVRGLASVHESFERQADSTPDALALIVPATGATGPRELTYRMLDGLANRMAQRLREAGAIPGTRVALALERSADFVVAALAALKSGSAYVPVDPDLPAERLATMLADAGASVLVTRTELRRLMPADRPTVVLVAETGLSNPLAARLASVPNGEAPAYVMYTSGSTGVPKGVVVPHRAILRLAFDTTAIAMQPSDVVLACAPVSFDASTFEIWGSLLNGGTLVLYPPSVPEPAVIADLLAAHRVTVLWLTAGLFHLVTETHVSCFSGLRLLLAGGDVLSPPHVRRALQALSGGTLVNGYGPTENTTFTCCHRMTGEADVGERVPIGRPISNTKVYVLDGAMQPVPVGVRGELWAGGTGVALGYLNDPHLTASRFLPDPFSPDPSARLYRTGDLARWRADGVLEFLGRIDGQIKIRGFRVEPSEVEQVLCDHPDVAEAIATARDGSGGKSLVAYVVPAASRALSAEALRTFLRERLPEYAVPSFFVSVATLPLTQNGKVDYGALPLPAEAAAEESGPLGGLETQLAVIWEQVLGVTGIGRRDNFFELGGNSLLGVRLLANLEKALGVRIPMSVLFQGQTIESMAAALAADCRATSFRAVAIQPAGSQAPLFVVPGVHGDVFGYQALAGALGNDQPLYCLRSRGLDGEAPPWETVEAIAADLVAEIRRIQPDGPYRLMGFCMGGIVGFEVARQLVAQGQTLELLALIDTWPPIAIRDRKRLSRYALYGYFILAGLRRHFRALRQQPRGQRLRYLREKSRIVSEMLAQRDVYRGERHVLYRQLVTRANQRAAARYVPARYEGDTLMVLAREPKGGADRDPRMLWKAVTGGTWTEVRIPAQDSGFLLKQPLVQQVADVLRRASPPRLAVPVSHGAQPGF